MIYVHILGDGTAIPEVGRKYPIILIREGGIYFGAYNKENFRKGNCYLDKPENAASVEPEIWRYILNECGEILQKRHAVHLLCPQYIAKKMIWRVDMPEEQVN